MDSREKVARARHWLFKQKPEDEGSAQNLQALAAIMPLVVRAIPDDAAELDHYLRTIATACAACRSDDARPLGVFELIDGEWHRVELTVP
jgi:hypothetical protein